jgi:GMP synthase (glutamine-hydrolysing)
MSAVQAVSIESGGGRFWGVQYHPEFSAVEMTRIFHVIEAQLVAEGTFESPQAVARMINRFGTDGGVFDRIELRNWLASLD